MVNYGRSGQTGWAKGDHTNVDRFTRPSAELSEKWMSALSDPQVWRVARDYLELLGDGLVETMGYSAPDLRRVLESSRPPLAHFTASLDWLVRKPVMQRTPWERRYMRMMRVLHRALGRPGPVVGPPPGPAAPNTP